MIGLDDDRSQLDWNNPTGWAAIGHLHSLGNSEVLAAACAACTDADPLRRRIGAAVLGQLGHKVDSHDVVFGEARYRALHDLLLAEREGLNDPDVLNDVCTAFGHLNDARAIPALLELQSHPDADVRLGVVSGLSRHEIPEAIAGLIVLSSDVDEDVRDWATFGLGQQIATDTPAIRAALHARLNDPCIAARNEAIEGLAARGDRSVLPFLISELGTGVALPLLDAAISLATPELCEALAATAIDGLIVETGHGPFDLTDTWKEAMQACGCGASGDVASAVQKS